MYRAVWKDFLRDETGQDLAESCLITALIALGALGLYFGLSGHLHDLWGAANSALANGGPQGGASVPATASTPAR
jgi:Flp pilus assembly pilin Flp